MEGLEKDNWQIQKPLFRFYAILNPVTLHCDASDSGLVSAILQGEQPIAYASRTLSPAEKIMRQSKRDVGNRFSCERFDTTYVGHNSITVQSGQRALEQICKNTLIGN